MTPHIEANIDDIAKIVIMPGDPKRVEYIVKNYLTDYKLINDVRKETAYTGYYKGTKITIFSSGMGIPSMGIYSHELYTVYNVDTIIRIGSAGSYSKDLNVNDLYLVESSYSESNYARIYSNNEENVIISNDSLNEIITKTASSLNYELKKGRCYSSEVFYSKNTDINELRDKLECNCVEMETFSLFTNAKELNKKATCLLTISDSFITNEKLTSEEREKNFNKMITLALESACKINE